MRVPIQIPGLAFLCAMLAGVSLQAEELLKSGPQPGEDLPASFEPLVVTGPNSGTNHCLVCENGLNPVVMIFARENSAALIKLLVHADAACAKHRAENLGCFVVFLSKEDGLDTRLATSAALNGYKHVVLSIDAPEGPDGYKVSKDAEVTVVLYTKHKVSANHTFKKNELNESAIEKIMTDLAAMLAKKP